MTDDPAPSASAELTTSPALPSAEVPASVRSGESSEASNSASSAAAATTEPAASSPSSGVRPVPIIQRPITPVPLQWRSWPIVDSPIDLAMVAALIGAAAGPTFYWRGALPAVGAALVMLILCARQLMPTVYELSALGVTEVRFGRRRRIPWISIDRFIVGRQGAYLSSAGAPLEILRGLYLPWGAHREQVLATLRYYLPRAEEDREKRG